MGPIQKPLGNVGYWFYLHHLRKEDVIIWPMRCNDIDDANKYEWVDWLTIYRIGSDIFVFKCWLISLNFDMINVAVLFA